MVAYLTMRHMGVPEKAARASIEDLVSMPRTVKTVYGESDEAYGTNRLLDEILHGIGQGNGYGPIIWAGISSPLLKILRSRKYGVHIYSPITKEEMEMAGYSFVDDTDQIELNEETEWENVLENAQGSLELWECLLRTTGGAIEPTKTDWVKVLYEWKEGEPKLQKSNPADVLRVKNPDGEVEDIKQIEPNEARRTLGVWQAANGQETTQKEVLINKVKEWGLATENITRKEANTAIISTIGRSIRYPLAATAMDTKQCQEVDKHLKKQVLGKLGVVRTAPGIVAFSPTQMGGIGLHRTEIDQTIDHVKMILQHSHTNSVTGKLIRNSIEQLAIESGLGGNLLKANLDKINYLTENTWIENTIRSCKKYGIEIETNSDGLQKWTDRDEFIMEKAIRTLKGKDLRIFNKVRLYLQVATTSDIANADGKSIDRDIFLGQRSTSPSPSKMAYQWPHVPAPTRKEKERWMVSLGQVYGNTPGNPSLEYGNYRWYRSDCIDKTEWNYDVEGNKIYQKIGSLWLQWNPTGGNRRVTRGSATFTITVETVNSANQRRRPVTIRWSGVSRISIKCKGRWHPSEEIEDNQDTWYSPSLSTIDRRCIQNPKTFLLTKSDYVRASL